MQAIELLRKNLLAAEEKQNCCDSKLEIEHGARLGEVNELKQTSAALVERSKKEGVRVGRK